MQSHVLDGDGVNPELFKWLVRTSNSATAPDGFSFCIPETILYYGCASYWFYFDALSKSVQKRPSKMLDKAIIYDYFSKPPPKSKKNQGACRIARTCDICCYFVNSKSNGLNVQYMTAKELHAFLYVQKKDRFGVLQRYVMGKTDHATVAQIVWSPSLSFSVVRQNTAKIYDLSKSPNERCRTFDGELWQCAEFMSLPHFTDVLAVHCRCFVDYFAACEANYAIGRLVAYFVEDSDGDFFLLFTTSIRTVERGMVVPQDEGSAEEKKMFVSKSPKLVQPLSITVSGKPRLLVKRRPFVPPSQRLLSPFFTPGCEAYSEGDVAGYAAAVQRKVELMRKQSESIEQENWELSCGVANLRREATMLCHSLRPMGSPKTDDSQLARKSNVVVEDETFGELKNDSSSCCSPVAESQLLASFRSRSRSIRNLIGVSSPRARQRGAASKRGTAPKTGEQVVAVVTSEMTAAAPLFPRSAREAAKALLAEGLRVANVLSDQLYPIADAVSQLNRRLQKKRNQPAEKSPSPMKIAFPADILPFVLLYIPETWNDLKLVPSSAPDNDDEGEAEYEEDGSVRKMLFFEVGGSDRQLGVGANFLLAPSHLQSAVEDNCKMIELCGRRKEETLLSQPCAQLMVELRHQTWRFSERRKEKAQLEAEALRKGSLSVAPGDTPMSSKSATFAVRQQQQQQQQQSQRSGSFGRRTRAVTVAGGGIRSRAQDGSPVSSGRNTPSQAPRPSTPGANRNVSTPSPVRDSAGSGSGSSSAKREEKKPSPKHGGTASPSSPPLPQYPPVHEAPPPRTPPPPFSPAGLERTPPSPPTTKPPSKAVKPIPVFLQEDDSSPLTVVKAGPAWL